MPPATSSTTDPGTAPGVGPVAARAAAERLAAVDVDLREPGTAEAVVDLLGHLHEALARVAAADGR